MVEGVVFRQRRLFSNSETFIMIEDLQMQIVEVNLFDGCHDLKDCEMINDSRFTSSFENSYHKNAQSRQPHVWGDYNEKLVFSVKLPEFVEILKDC